MIEAVNFKVHQMTTWHEEGLPPWKELAEKYATSLACAIDDGSFSSRKNCRVYVQQTLQILPDQKVLEWTDYKGLKIYQSVAKIYEHIAIDYPHAGHVAWLAETLRNPIEVWVREHTGGYYQSSNVPKRHFLSAFRHNGELKNYIAAIDLNRVLYTAFWKERISDRVSPDTKPVRRGDLEYLRYR